MTITISKSETADTRTCDYTNVKRATLLISSQQHIRDVQQALRFFGQIVERAAVVHDFDKISDIDGFYRDFVTGFTATGWWDRHRALNRHHLMQPDGVPIDVNLVDVLDFISDCVMAGMARSGSVYDLKLPAGLLDEAFQNTVMLLTNQVVVQAQSESLATEPPVSE